MIKCIYFPFWMLMIVAFGSACSSNQAPTEQAIQQTVETQQIEQQSENTNAGNGETPTSLADSILGTWSGDPGLSVPGPSFVLDATFSYESFTFYEDVVIFRGRGLGDSAFLYNFINSDTLELVNVDGGSFGTLQITQEAPNSLILTLVYSDEPDNIYKSSNLDKVADVDIVDVTSLQEAILGSWTIELYDDVDVVVEFTAETVLIKAVQDSDFSLGNYEFQYPNRLVMYFPDDQPIIAEITMPNEHILIMWYVYEIENEDGKNESVVQYFGELSRIKD